MIATIQPPLKILEKNLMEAKSQKHGCIIGFGAIQVNDLFSNKSLVRVIFFVANWPLARTTRSDSEVLIERVQVCATPEPRKILSPLRLRQIS